MIVVKMICEAGGINEMFPRGVMKSYKRVYCVWLVAEAVSTGSFCLEPARSARYTFSVSITVGSLTASCDRIMSSFTFSVNFVRFQVGSNYISNSICLAEGMRGSGDTLVLVDYRKYWSSISTVTNNWMPLWCLFGLYPGTKGGGLWLRGLA